MCAGPEQQYGVTLASGFEDNAHVSGGVLRGTEVFGNARDDAMLLLEFHSGAVDLPLHVHEQSERFIVVERGRGFFHYVDPEGERNTVRARTVREGETIVFSRGLIHTFCAPTEPLRLLSYHAPFFEVQDPRQWMVLPEAIELQPTVDAFHRTRGFLFQRRSATVPVVVPNEGRDLFFDVRYVPPARPVASWSLRT